jgi:hypothetical protein
LNAYGINTYRDESSYPLPRAQRALCGRTHYVDDDTLRYFKARINSSHADFNGLYFYLVESVAHPERGRVHRVVLFDVFGEVLTDRGTFRKTAHTARKDLDSFLSTFDPIAHTEKALRSLVANDTRKINETRNILES